MRKEQAQLGEHYIAKISGTLTVIRLDKEHRSGGWVATNKATAKTDPKSDKAKAETNKATTKTDEAAAKPDKAETKEAGKPEGKYLTSVYAHKVFQANRGKYQGILFLETGAYHLAFGEDAELAARLSFVALDVFVRQSHCLSPCSLIARTTDSHHVTRDSTSLSVNSRVI